MRDFLKLIEGAQGDVYTREQLEAWDIDDLDRMAFGYVGDQEIEIDPSDITIKWHDDLGNPEYKFDLGGMDWVNSVDFAEPVELSITTPGKIELEDGHHRWFAAKKLGRKLKGIVQIKGNPINVILARQDTLDEEAPVTDVDSELLTKVKARAKVLFGHDMKQVSDEAEQFYGTTDQNELCELILEELKQTFSKGAARLERVINVPDEVVKAWKPGQNVGPDESDKHASWTTDASSLEFTSLHTASVHEYLENYFLITANVPWSAVDVVSTIAQKMEFHWENEIALLRDQRIMCLSIEKVGSYASDPRPVRLDLRWKHLRT